jgi:hypothetical protein
LILSFILLNKNVRLGKTLSVVALSINICYDIMVMIFILLNISSHTGEMILGLFVCLCCDYTGFYKVHLCYRKRIICFICKMAAKHYCCHFAYFVHPPHIF